MEERKRRTGKQRPLLQPPKRSKAECSALLSVLSSLACIKSVNSKNFLISDIRSILQKSTEDGHHIRLVWIPSHIGLQGNEAADRLALHSCKTDTAAALDTPTPDLKSQIAFYHFILWDTHWRLTNQHKGKDYAQLFPQGHVPKSTWFDKIKGQTRSCIKIIFLQSAVCKVLPSAQFAPNWSCGGPLEAPISCWYISWYSKPAWTTAAKLYLRHPLWRWLLMCS
jgi:hypothetical protein